MSRSDRKTPTCGSTTAKPEKEDKRLGNRKVRRVNRVQIAFGEEPISRKTLANPWDMAKDGKQRFNPEKMPELMRK